MRLNHLTNPDNDIQKKMRFFSDYFIFANEYLGRLPNLPFDNPQSLVSKIIFQIENNIERSPKYIENYFSVLISFYGPFLVRQTIAYNTVKTNYDNYQNEPQKEKVRVKWLKNNNSLYISLKDLFIELDKTLFPTIFLWLSNYMTCIHKLEYHEKDIKFSIQILVSLFRLNGHTKKSVDGYINRILSSSRHSFPFPPEIYNHNKKHLFIQAADEFLKNRDFKKQFEGLKNLMLNEKHLSGYFIYPIKNVQLDDKNFKVRLDKVTFISPKNSKFIKLKKSIKQFDKEHSNAPKTYPRFFGKGILLAYVNLNYENIKFSSEKGAQIVRSELKQFSQYIDGELNLQDVDFLFTKEFQVDDWNATINLIKTKTIWLDSFKIQRVKGNPFELLRTSSAAAKAQLLHNESVFIKAFAEDDVAYYWQYIENLFWFENEPNDGVRAKFTKIIMKDLEYFISEFLMSIGLIFHNLPFSGYSASSVGLTEAELKQLTTELAHKRNIKFPLKNFQTKFNHPFLKSITKEYLNVKSKSYISEWQKYFSILILELYEYRNSALHSGRVNPFLKIKLTELMPIIMNRVRWVVVNACKENDQLEYSALIALLTN